MGEKLLWGNCPGPWRFAGSTVLVAAGPGAQRTTVAVRVALGKLLSAVLQAEALRTRPGLLALGRVVGLVAICGSDWVFF